MSWLRGHPALAIVLALNVGWTLIAAASSEERPWGARLWLGEGTPVEILEVVLLLGYIGVWAWIAHTLRAAERRLAAGVAAAMVVQLVVLLGEELDWLRMLGSHRNLRDIVRLVLPQILDTPVASIFLMTFLLAPLVPSRRLRAVLDRAAPVRAEPADGAATLIGPPLSLLIYPLVGDQELGELHQIGIYAVLGLVTARIARAVGARP